jgi:response regulator of citrate/malate metabolism
MAKKKKRMAKTMPMRALEQKGIPFEVHQHAHKQVTAEGVAEDLGISKKSVQHWMTRTSSWPQSGMYNA